MSKIIVVHSLEFPVSGWTEGSLSSSVAIAGHAPAAQDADKQRPSSVQLGANEVSFDCVVAHSVGTPFNLKDDGRSFVVTSLSGKTHRARTA